MRRIESTEVQLGSILGIVVIVVLETPTKFSAHVFL